MTAYNTLLQFIIPAVAGAIGLVTLAVFENRQLKHDRQVQLTFILICLITSISVFYFTLYTREIFLKESEVAGVFRILDYWLYALIPVIFIHLIHETAGKGNHKRLLRCSQIITAVFLVLYLICAVFMMDSGYHISSYGALVFYHVTELAFTAVFSVLIIYTLKSSFRKIHKKAGRLFIYTAASIILYMLYTLWDTRNLGYEDVVTWSEEPIDLTGWFLGAANVLILCFIFGYLVKKEKNLSVKDKINELARECALTDREKEVLILMYDGFGNSEISEQLYISLNTVKSHVKHIFRKLSVNSRLELIQLINETKED